METEIQDGIEELEGNVEVMQSLIAFKRLCRIVRSETPARANSE